MRISTFAYVLKQGIKNIWTNLMFSLASIATMGACIFLFGLFFSIIMNFTYIVRTAEEGVSMTVFFEENTDQATIDEIGVQIRAMDGVKTCNYISAEQAWEQYRQDYFEEQQQDVAEGFKDNPLANSANYEVFVDDVSKQESLVTQIESLTGVRTVNRSEVAAKTLSTVNRLIGYISLAIIIILLAVAIFLISNTVAVGISVRKEEIGIMKLIGATDHIVRAPFIVEGILIGLIGSVIPLVLVYFIYNNAVSYILNKFHMLSNLIQFLPVGQVFQTLLPVGLLLGMGIGLVGSLFTIRKHLRV